MNRKLSLATISTILLVALLSSTISMVEAKPNITIRSPSNGAEVSGTTTIEIKVTDQNLHSIFLRINQKLVRSWGKFGYNGSWQEWNEGRWLLADYGPVGTVTHKTVTYDWDTSTFSNGTEVTITVKALSLPETEETNKQPETIASITVFVITPESIIEDSIIESPEGSNATNPNEDPDGDGLSTRIEETIGSDPNSWDTDGDGISDGIEYVMNVTTSATAAPAPQVAAGVVVIGGLAVYLKKRRS